MSNIIAKIAFLFGWETWYHVTFEFFKNGATTTIDATIAISPWLRRGSGIDELREELIRIGEPHGCTKTPNIINITRIGS